MSLAIPSPRAPEVRALLALALPVIAVQVGMMAMGVVDTIMVGHLSAAALAAVALGNVYYFACSIFGMGCLMALDPVIAQAIGAGDHEAAARGLQRGMLLGLLLTVPTSLALLPAPAVLTWLRQPPDVAPVAGQYAVVSIPGTLGFFAFVVLRQSLQAMGRMRPIVVTIIVANLLNVGLNWVLIFGHLGAPPLGAIGAAWASVASRLFMGGLLLALGWSGISPYLVPLRQGVFHSAPLGRMLRLGAPIGLQHQLEYGVFGLVGVLMGVLGTNQVAGHQVALNLASITFMVPLGLSAAAAVAVGHAIGRGDPDGARRAARASLTIAIGFMGFTAICFLLLPGPLARLYTTVQPVMVIATALIPIAGLFQVFDGIQVTSIGILRGLGDTRTPMVVNLLGFWLLGLPVSLWLGFTLKYGPRGLWWGLTIGLVIVALVLLARVRHRLEGPLERLHIDHPPTPDAIDPCCASAP